MRPCSILHCPRQQVYRVVYTNKLGKTKTSNWAKVCSHHAIDFPWGTVVSKGRI